MEDVWLRMESMNNYKGFYWSVGSHGNTEDGSHIMHFPGGHGEPETSIDLDAFTAELFGPDNKELHGKIKFATHALCRGPESDVTTYECDARSPQRRTKRAANVRVPIMKAPNAVKVGKVRAVTLSILSSGVKMRILPAPPSSCTAT